MVDLYVNGTMHEWTSKAKFIITTAIKLNNAGDYFPIWGTCQGHELLNVVMA